jgi:hypothetical protein
MTTEKLPNTKFILQYDKYCFRKAKNIIQMNARRYFMMTPWDRHPKVELMNMQDRPRCSRCSKPQLNIPRVRFLLTTITLPLCFPSSTNICSPVYVGRCSRMYRATILLFTGVESHTSTLFIRRGVLGSSKDSTFLPFSLLLDIV